MTKPTTLRTSSLFTQAILLLGAALVAPALASCNQANSGSPTQEEPVSHSTAALGSAVVLPTYTLATLPPPGTNGSLARLTDSTRGIWIDNGTSWAPVHGRTVDPMDFGAVGYPFTGSAPSSPVDACPAIQAAIDSLGYPGGTVLFPAGLTFYCSSQLNLDLKPNVHLAGSVNSFDGSFYNIVYTGSDSQFISIRSSAGTAFEHIKIQYNNSAFVGVLVNADHAFQGAGDTEYLTVDSSTFSGTESAHGARALLRLANTIASTVKDSHFLYSNVSILGYDDGDIHAFSASIQIENTTFNYYVKSAIRNADEAWLVKGCTFEPSVDNKGIAYTHDPTLFRFSRGFTWTGNWFGDADASGTWLEVLGLGFTFSGNRVGPPGAAGTSLVINSGTEGVVIDGNQFDGGQGQGIFFEPYGPRTDEHAHPDFGVIRGVSITGNKICSIHPIVGYANVFSCSITGNETETCGNGINYNFNTTALSINGEVSPFSPGLLGYGFFDPSNPSWQGKSKTLIGYNSTTNDLSMMTMPSIPSAGIVMYTNDPPTQQMRVSYQGVQIADGSFIKSHSVGQTTWPTTSITIPAGGLQFVTISVPITKIGYSVALGYDQILPDGVTLSGQVVSASTFIPTTGQATSPGTVRATVANLSGSPQTINAGGALNATVWGH